MVVDKNEIRNKESNIIYENSKNDLDTESEEVKEKHDEEKEEVSYEETKKVINDIVVELFKNILMIEERSLRHRGIRDLSIGEIHALEAVGTGQGKMMSDVAEALDVTMGTLTTTISKLEKKGYVTRTKLPEDRRVVIAALTKKGELVEKIHRNFHDEMIDHLIIDLKLDEDKTLIQSLKNINEFFLKEYGGNNDY